MMEKVSTFFRSIYSSLTSAGVSTSIPPDQRRTVLLMNQVLLVASLINLVGLVVYFANDLFLSALVNFVCGIIFQAGIYLNRSHKFKAARILCIVNVNLYIIVINIVEGSQSGEYLFYFPAFISLTFLVRIYKDYRELIVTYIVTIIAALVCIQFIPANTNLQWVNAKTASGIFNSRLVLCILLTIYVSYLVLRANRDNEKQILEEKKFGDAIFNTSLDGVLIVQAASGKITDCNQRMLEMFDLNNRSQILDSALGDWFDSEYIEKFRLTNTDHPAANWEDWQGEVTVKTHTSRVFYGYASAVSFNYKETRYLKIGILDITNVKSAELELLAAKEKAESAVKMKSRFLSNMSHELRTPLNGIIGVSNLLQQEEYLPGQRPQLDILKYSSEQMLVLINDILDHTKMEAGKMELEKVPVNMKALVDKVITQFSGQVEAKKLQFKTYVDPALDLELITDETRLQQVMGNLLSNAIKFTNSGSITLSANKIFASSNKATIQVMVKDTGIGIPLHKQKEIFESFTQADTDTTRKFGGTGLGLTITKDLLKMFGSELVLQSEVDKGTQFIFMLELPINENRKIFMEPRKNDLVTLAGTRVLVAEDNPVNMAIVRRFLQKWDIEVAEAVNGLEAVKLFRNGKFDLLLIDLDMPEMDGMEALKEIRTIDKNIPVVAFTAAVYENIRADLQQKGFTDFLHKPFKPEDLHTKITRWTTALRA